MSMSGLSRAVLNSAASGAGTTWHGGAVPHTFTHFWAREAPRGKQETGQNVLPITKAGTKATKPEEWRDVTKTW